MPKGTPKNKTTDLVQAETQFIMESIRKIVRALRQSSKVSEKAMNLSTAQLFVLQKVAESGKSLSINELAVKTFTHQSSVSVVVKKLLAKKLVERVKSENDARVVEVKLSSAGKELLKGSRPLIQEKLVKAIEELSQADRQALRVGFESLLEHTGIEHEEAEFFFEGEK